MDWVLANWFWILIFGLFIAMHLFGHGGHGGHGGGHQHGSKTGDEKNGDETQANTGNTSSSGHEH